MDLDQLPVTGTCDLTTTGRRSGRDRRIEIWYVVVDRMFVVTGTPGARDWLANLRAQPAAVLRLRRPTRDVEVTVEEVVDADERRRVITEVFRLQPWYADQPYSVDEWVAAAPIVVLTAAP